MNPVLLSSLSLAVLIGVIALGFLKKWNVGSLSFGAALAEYMGIFAVTQIPLAVVEGVLSAIVVMLLESFAKPELREIGFLAKEGAKS